MGCSPWGHWELDTTERGHFHFSLSCIGPKKNLQFQILSWDGNNGDIIFSFFLLAMSMRDLSSLTRD